MSRRQHGRNVGPVDALNEDERLDRKPIDRLEEVLRIIGSLRALLNLRARHGTRLELRDLLVVVRTNPERFTELHIL